MKEQPIKETHYGKEVWVNPLTENMRHDECLCFNCTNLEGCKTAKKIYKVCVDDNMAMTITRCPEFKQDAT